MEGYLIISHKIKHIFIGSILKTKLCKGGEGVVIHVRSSYVQEVNVV
jgi:hypothetical protein